MNPDYAGVVQGITRTSVSLAIIAFLVSAFVEFKKEQKSLATAPKSLSERFGELETHLRRATSAAALPAAFALIYSAFDAAIIPHMLSIHYWIAIAGLTLAFTSTRLLLK